MSAFKNLASLQDPTLLETVLADLRLAIADNSRVTTSPEALEKHIYSTLQLYAGPTPNVVVFAISTEEILQVLKIASKHRVPVIPYGGGTSIEGGFGAPYGGISLDVSRMNKVLEFRPGDLDVTLQPGVIWNEFNDSIEAEHGLFFPVDPGLGATFGGMIATSCSGTNAARYGTMKDGWVLGMKVVLADGSVIRTKGRTKKSSAGFDLNRLMIGSEGTLGIVTEITLKLAIVPKHTSVITCAFDAVEDAITTTSLLLRGGINFQCIEFLDEVFIKSLSENRHIIKELVNPSLDLAPFPDKPHLFIKLAANTEDILRADHEALRSICPKNADLRIASSADERNAFWALRKRALPLIIQTNRQEKKPSEQSTDVCVPMSEFAGIAKAHRKDLDRRGLEAGILGHAGDGNLHSLIKFDAADTKQTADAEAAHVYLVQEALQRGGTCTGEHGIGRAKAVFLRDEHGERNLAIMKGIKAVYDPLGILNPGQIFPEDDGADDMQRLAIGTMDKGKL